MLRQKRPKHADKNANIMDHGRKPISHVKETFLLQLVTLHQVARFVDGLDQPLGRVDRVRQQAFRLTTKPDENRKKKGARGGSNTNSMLH